MSATFVSNFTFTCCVLYEMLTGTRAFAGDDITDTLAFVITKEPDWGALPAAVPAGLRRLLRRSLEKERKRRLADAADARLEIDDATAVAEPANIPNSSGIRSARVAWSVTAAIVLTAGAISAFVALRERAELPNVRFLVSPPDGWAWQQLQSSGASPAPVALSPDGRRLAFTARSDDGRQLIWIRDFDRIEPHSLAGTDGAELPFWAPDGAFLGFFADRKLKKVSVSGGPPVSLADAPSTRGGSWSRDNVIVFAPTSTSGLQSIPAAGGTPRPATRVLDGDGAHTRPFFLPDGRHFLYRANINAVSGPVYVASLDSSERTLAINADNSNVLFASGHLLFLRETTLMAQRFDLGRLQTIGDAFPIAEQIRTTGSPSVGVFSASQTGVLAYQTGPRTLTQLAWFDRAGRLLEAFGEPADYGDLELSPNGSRLAVSVRDAAGGSDLWVFDNERRVRVRLTFDAARDFFPVWSPDGLRILFASDRGDEALYERLANGGGTERLLLSGKGVTRPFSWSQDGQYVLYETGSPIEVWTLPRTSGAKPFPLVQVPFNTIRPKFSPDGRWVAYGSQESGRAEIYITSFPKAEGKWQASTAGGQWHRWRRDGRELYYIAPDNYLMALEVDGHGESIQLETARRLFPLRAATGRNFVYDVSPDGQRFVVNTTPDQVDTAPTTIVLDWTAGLPD